MAKKYYLDDHGLVTYNELIKKKISELVSFDVSVLDELPATGVEHILYLIPSKSEMEENVRDEYLWIVDSSTSVGVWECIGSTAINLDNYYTKDEIDASLAEKQDILQGSSTIDISNNVISALGYIYNQEEGSFAIGDSSKNVLEVLNTGEVYVKGIGNYDGTTTENASTLQQVIDSSLWYYVGDWSMFNPDYRVYKFFYYNTYNHEKFENEYTSKFANVYDIDTSKYCLVSKQYFTNVGNNAFKDCHTLNYVEIPQLVKEIKENAFSGCTALLPLTLSDKLESVTNYSLYDVPNVIYSGQLDTSEWGAKAINGYVEDMFVYYDDTKTQLEACSSEANGNIVIPDGVDVINDRAFSYCMDVSTIYVPHSLEILGDDVFEGCSGINEFIYDGNIDEWNEVEKYEYWFLKSSIEYVKCNDGDIYLYEHATELYLDGGEKVRTFTNSLDYDHMQYFIDRMEQCYIGDYVTDIYENTFNNWRRTDILYYKGTMQQWNNIRKWGCWYNNSNITTVRCSDGDIDLYDVYGTKLYNSNGDIIQRFLSTEINRDMIDPYRSDIARCEIGYFVNTINEYAFQDCYNMTEIVISGYVENIKQCAFMNCSGLTSITIPTGVKYIENDIINSCHNLTVFNYAGEKNQWYLVEKNSNWFNNSRLNEYDYSYIHCSDGDIDLATVYYYNDDTSTRNLTKYLNNEYSYDTLVKCEVGDAVINIDNYSFENCSNLAEFSFTSQIESVNEYVFNNCSNLTEITFYGSEEQWNNFNKSDYFLAGSGVEVVHCLDKDLTFTKLYLDNDEIVTIYQSGQLEQQYIEPYRDRITKVEIGSSVTSIGSYAFSDCRNLTSINIPDSVTSISNDAFNNCYSLASIDIPNSVTSIGNEAFMNCSSLTSITISDSVTSINGWTFYGCSSLASIDIPNSVTDICSDAFSQCSSLASINIPDSVTSIDSYAFENCSSLTSINIPESVEHFQYDAIVGCYSLTSITVDSNNQVYDSRNNCNAIIETNSNKLISGCKTTTIPDSVTSIGDFAFNRYSSLTSITIPDSVTSIGTFAFDYCGSENNPLQITFESETPISLYNGGILYAFGNKNEHPLYLEIIVPSGYENTYATHDSGWEEYAEFIINPNISIFYYADGGETTSEDAEITSNSYDNQRTLVRAKLGRNATSIGSSAFRDCSGLTSINISDSVTIIDSNAFDGCRNLTSVTIGNSVTNISSEAFYYCSSLTSIIIPDSVTSIGSYAFYYCSSLTSIIIPDSVTSIGSYAFYNCRNLTSVTIGDSVASIGNQAFRGCSSLTSVTIGNSVTSIGDYIFTNCRNLTSVTIPDSVTSIGNGAFSDCSGLTSIDIPDSVTSIGNEVFYGCSSLTSIDIPDSVTSIGNHVFSYCSSLTSITVDSNNQVYDSRNNCNAIIETNSNTLISGCQTTIIPNSVTSIGNSAFQNCSGLTTIDIPDSVTNIGPKAFYDCSDLTSVTIGNSVTSIGYYTFYNCSGLTSITIPESVTSIGSNAFDRCSNLTSIDIPDSVTSIGDSAFYYCSNLTSITSRNAIPPTIQSNTFNHVTKSIPVYVPSESVSTYQNTNNWSKFTNIQQIPSAIFYYSDETTSTTTDTTITSSSRDTSKTLVRAKLNNSVTNIGDGAFDDCSSLTSINIPDSVTSIGYSAFQRCSSLTSINIPDSLTSIGYSTFQRCSSLTSIIVDLNNQVYDSRNNCNAIIETNSNTLISGCQNTVIPDSVTSIGQSAFEGCSSLTSIDIPDSITSIGDGAFDSCSSLISINIPDSVTSIGVGVFYYCSSLTSINIPDSVTDIGGEAFQGCSSLTSINIPDSVTDIGPAAFQDCSNLTSITSKRATPPTIYSDTFYNVDKSIPVYAPSGSVSAYQTTGYWNEFTNIQAISE